MLKVEQISRSYGAIRALHQLSLSLAAGEVLGFLGPNGAGKSTAMKIITGFLAADEGRVEIDGLEVHDNPIATRTITGWMPEHVPLYEEMEVGAYLRFVAEARGVKKAGLAKRVEECAERVEIVPMLRRPIADLSRGYRQRTCLASAILHDPKLLVLDEPTAGLDPTQIETFHTLIRGLAQDEGKAVIFSTHILSEIEAVAEKVVVIDRGKCVFKGSKAELAKGSSSLAEAFGKLVGAKAASIASAEASA